MRLALIATVIAATCLSFATAGSAGTYGPAGAYGTSGKQCITKRMKTRDYAGRWAIKRVRVCQ